MKEQAAIVSRLRQRITIQQQSQTPDTGGGFSRSWGNVATVWAEVIPISGREVLANQQLQGQVTHRITIRYRSGVTTAMRVAYEGRVFNIRSVLNIRERDDLLEILAEEGVAT